MGKKKINEECAKYEEVNVVPPIEMIEREREAYVREMEDYLNELKRMKKSDAQKKSFENLVESNIIGEDGDFTERYEYTKSTLEKKR